MLTMGMKYVAYGISMILGLATLIFPLPTIAGIVGLPLTYVYGVLLFAGSVIIIVGLAKNMYLWELIGLWLVAGGYIIFDILLWSLFTQRLIDPPSPELRGSGYAASLAISILPIVMFRRIHWLDQRVKANTPRVANSKGDTFEPN